MKPPSRTRTKPDRNLKTDLAPQCSGKLACKWQRAEQCKLLKALKTSRRTVGGHGDIDYTFLRKQVPTRSISEIHGVVESLKNKVISCATLKLKKKRSEDKKVRKPIEVWTHMASAVAGTLEEPISSAFSQMQIVSSTEPRTLRNCDPPQVHRPPNDKERPVGHTIPFRPMPYVPVQGEDPARNTAHPLLILKTQAPTTGPAKRLLALSKVVRAPNSEIPPPEQQPSNTAGTSPATACCSSQTTATCRMPVTAEILSMPPKTPQPASAIPVRGQASLNSSSTAVVKTACVGSSVSIQQPSEQHPTTTCTQKSTLSSWHKPLSSSLTSLTPLPSTTPTSVASSSSAILSCSSTHPMPQFSSPARFVCTSKYAAKVSPRTFGVKFGVDFERIYLYLSGIHKPNEECKLTPMESAIMLNLLMSLPEELSLMDCNKLHKHLIQVYQCLSSPANSKMAGETFKDLKGGLSAEAEAEAETEAPGCRESNRTDTLNTAKTVDSSDVINRGGRKLKPDEAESQSSWSNNTSSQSGNANMIGLCPPLNPFMVPLKLLMRK